jgi:N6-adenosine-specific RNA methylase IME4
MSNAERQHRYRAKLAKKVARKKDGVAKRQAIRADYEARAVKGGTVHNLQALAASGERFAIIYADPPWSFEVCSGKGKQRSADRYYDTSSLDAIKALPVAPLAAKDCALFLWCTMPNLPAGLAVIEAWGFEYKTTGFTWIKQNPGGQGLFMSLGYWTRANAEICLLATRGSPTRMAADVPQVVMSPVGAHSAKPPEVRARIERLLVGPYLELYAREQAPGWKAWGNEIP